MMKNWIRCTTAPCCSRASPGQHAAQTLFDFLLPAMKRRENDARTRHDLNEIRQRTKGRRRRRRKQRQLERSKLRRMAALLARAVISWGRARLKLTDFSTIGKWPRTNCAFKNERLNKTDNERLTKRRNEGIERQKGGGGRSAASHMLCMW